MIDTGKFKDRVTFRNNTGKVQNASGGHNDSYSNVLTTRGLFRSKSGSFGSFEGTPMITNECELIVRYQSALNTQLKVETYVSVNGNDYKVLSWEIVEQEFKYVKLQLARNIK